MNVTTTRTHTLTLNDRERDLLATLIAKIQRTPNIEEIHDFADQLFDHLETAGARIILEPHEAMPASLNRK